MASKKSRPLDDPPAASSSEEEEEESSSEEEEEEVPEKPQSKPQPKQPQTQSQSEEEESQEEEEEEEEEEDEDEEEQQKKKTQKQNPVPKMTPQPELDSETESESQKASDFTIKPIKSTEEKPETPETGTPVSKPSAKRRAENGEKVASKSKKVKPSSEEEEGGGVSTPAEKKSAVSRLWSEKDELQILQGLIDFQANTGKDPSSHQQEFHEFVKKSLRVDASKSQVMDKVRRLKSKFKTAVSKAPNGLDPVYSKPHEVKFFILAKKIWGSSSEKNGVADTEKSKANANEKSNSRNSKKSNNDKLAVVDANADLGATKEEDMVKGKSEKVGSNQVKEEEEDLGKKYPNLMGAFRPDYMSNMGVPDILKGNLNLVGSLELKEMDNKWKKQNAAELEMFLGRIDLLREQTRMVLDAMRSSKN